MLFEYQTAWTHLQPGGFLLSHNTGAPFYEVITRQICSLLAKIKAE